MQGKIDHELHDCCLSSFAMMFFQDPSINQFQMRLQEAWHKNNLQTLFNVNTIPKETQMREVVDSIQSKELEPIFADFFKPLQRGKQLEQFKMFNDSYFIPIDATQYFVSQKINCPKCLYKKYSNGKTTFYHQVVAAAIVCPGIKQVIPLAPEPIQNTDGTTKQDCEINAGKRLLKKIRADHPKLKITIGGDSLYSKQPFLDELKANNMSFILVAKPGDHRNLYQWFTETKAINAIHTLKIKDWKGKVHVYEWLNDIPLNDTKNADNVNFFQYSIFKGKKELSDAAGSQILKSLQKTLKSLLNAEEQDGKLKMRLSIL